MSSPELAIASPLRARRGFQPPGAMIIPHLASRLKPFNDLASPATPRSDPGTNSGHAAAICFEFCARSCIAATLAARSKLNLAFERGHRL